MYFYKIYNFFLDSLITIDNKTNLARDILSNFKKIFRIIIFYRNKIIFPNIYDE